jgi:uncharacterized phage-associated protein
MRPQFQEAKATQLAAFLLKKRGGRMHYLKLIKLMYLIDREGLSRWGRSMTRANYVSMDKGPVLSEVLNLITEERLGESYWRRFISAPQGYEVALENEPEFDEFSRAELRLVEEIYERFGHWNRWDLVHYTHDLPEWRNPNGSSLPIDYREVLQAEGKSYEEIAEIMGDIEETARFESYALK